MPRPGRHTQCTVCSRPATKRRVLSTRGICGQCAEQRVSDAATQLANRQGPFYERWLAGQAAAIDRLGQQFLPGTGDRGTTTSSRSNSAA